MKKLFLLLITALSLTVSGAALFTAQPALASNQSQVCGGIGGCDEKPAQISNTVRNVVNIFTAIIGTVTVIVIIVAGLRFITSGGDSSKVAGAKTTLIYALVGLIVVLLSQALVRFVLNRAT